MLNELFSYGCLTLNEINEIDLLTRPFLDERYAFTSIVFSYHFVKFL